MKFEWNKSMTKRAATFFAAGAGIILFYFILKNWGEVISLWNNAADILRPFTFGIIFAYLLNGPLMFFEKHLAFIEQKKPRRTAKRVLAIIVTWIATIAVLSAFFYIVMPDVTESINFLINNIPYYLSSLQGFVGGITEAYNIEAPFIDYFLNFEISSEVFADILREYGEDLLPQIANIANLSVRIGSTVFDIIIAIVLSVYIMFSKETLIAQLKKGLYAILKKENASNLVRFARESHRIFSGFINGKLLDSLIIGILCFIGMSLIGLEFTMLISFIVGCTNVIPFFGPFLGAIPSVLILLMVDPWQALWFGIFVLVLQQLDGNVIGPKILGDSTGLPALWVMFAILVGGGIFGILGMFVGVPAFAVIYKFTKEFLESKLSKKELPEQTESYKVIKGIKDSDEIEKGATK
ncbi:MAG: AI-2E family transporter [Oscillospiraceae bacterium]|nr:AI-2E family transporter [Oscillospiraceae bacterium]